ncbi:MAG: undecaprenyl-phosphate glucose phosphotransferase [Candidatus Scalindua rubra]|uniref:Capsular polysaccharide synthesis protein n=1 Tax=Candidatus Scalindua brodae TaxID=237368 RepID=A0A0B0EQK4_9BACT|nr:MAG: capsular polysaccharide synthesis protein [Candidatus Scalindua brodae]MBZ0108743.1 undecaprenyl-phosphate glucose phosphotransferase [Candidatus Scalindua rubra]TWU33063.1 UDP-glucose:undecaprenyl-phosphate glucose-1-phosphate transferase [Candidatus Brocadiaceae bacterium S225]
MLKKHSKFFETLVLIFDWIALCCSWMLAYYLRFYFPVIPVSKGIPPFVTYLTLLIIMLPLWYTVFKAFGLYRPRRISSRFAEIIDIAKGTTIAILILVSLTFFVRKYEFSRLTFLYFWIICMIILCVERILFREFLRFIRKRGYNLRHALIVGTGNLAMDVTDKVHNHPELGIKIRGFLSDDKSQIGNELKGFKVLDTCSNIRSIVMDQKIDMVLITLPLSAHERLKRILDSIGDEMVSIMLIPDLIELATLRGGIGEFEGMPIISLRDTPLYGWNLVIKRVADVVLSITILLAVSPLMLVISVLVRATSKGPVFYKQERMGLDGKVFSMLKFRTMETQAEKETGPVWATKGDSRKTIIGAFLRKTSMDELPQFFNVLKGDMSIVGPRPEREFFIQQFRSKIPKYMLRHKMKAGITGWAQISGWRGNTSLEKRIEYDLYYIENWSLRFDMEIMWLTIWRGLVNKHAY